MRKLSKVLTCLLVLMLALPSCIGCRVTPDDGEETEVTKDTLRLYVVAKGYGVQWEREMAKAFMNKTGISTIVMEPGQDDGYPGIQVALGPGVNEVDIFFPTENFVHQQLADKNFVKNWNGPTWADLSDVWDSPAVGYKECETNPDLKIKDLVSPEILNYMTYTDGHQYMMGYATSICSLLYNKTLFDETNDELEKNGKAPITLPRTSKEMVEIFQRITDLRNSKDIAPDVYAYAYSGSNDYTMMLTMSWWGQYEGKESAFRALEGQWKNPDTNEWEYSPEIFRSNGRKYAVECSKNMFRSGFCDPLSSSNSFTQAQLDFLRGKAFFNANGDWLEREASKNFNPGEADVAFIKVPLISEIVLNPAVSADFPGGLTDENDRKLREIVDYIDGGEAGTKPAVSDATLDFLRDSRKFGCQSEAFARPIHVTAYSPRLDKAKEFLKFMYSKEGQEIQMKAAFGTMAPIDVDMSQFDYYQNDATVMARSKIDLFKNSYVFGNTKHCPIQYLGGLGFSRFDGHGPNTWVGTASDTVCGDEYKFYNSMWNTILTSAGLQK